MRAAINLKAKVYTHGEKDVWSMLVTGDNDIDRTYGHTSSAQEVTYGNESYIYFWNRYTKVGVICLIVVKYVIINGQAIDTDNPVITRSQRNRKRSERYVGNHIVSIVSSGVLCKRHAGDLYEFRGSVRLQKDRQVSSLFLNWFLSGHIYDCWNKL